MAAAVLVSATTAGARKSPRAHASWAYADGQFACASSDGSGWTQVFSGANSFFVGNCWGNGAADPSAWHLQRSIRSTSNDINGNWDGGYFPNSNINGCGWVRSSEDQLDHSAAYTICNANAPRDPAEFQVYNNGNTTTAERNGAPVLLTVVPCQAYANVRPFGSVPSATNPVQLVDNSLTPGGSIRFNWRYVVKGGQYVAGRDAVATGPVGPKWVFLPRSCLPATLPLGG